MPRRTKNVENLTEASVRDLVPRDNRFEVWDEDVRSLVVRVSPTGHKSFAVLRRKKGGRLERITIGSWPDVSVKDARDQARTFVGDLTKGVSIAAERRSLRRGATLNDLWTLFLQHHAKLRKRSWRTDENRWTCHLEQYGREPLTEITPAKVSTWLAKITASRGKIAANRVRALLMTMFNVGRKQFGLRVVNPVRDTPRHRENTKDRYLQPEELRRFLEACQAADPVTRDFCKLALLTGQRTGTLCAMRWTDLNLRDGVWNIPGEFMKAGRPLTVPIARRSVEVLEARKAMASSTEWVFPSGRPAGYIAPPRHGFDRVTRAAGIENLTPHDLRRTFATIAVEAGVGLGEIARLLGHTPAGGVTAIYARTPMTTLRRAVEKISRAILPDAGESAVVPFQRSAD